MRKKRVAKGKRKIAVSVALSRDLAARIDRMAMALGQSRSELVTQLIEEGIDEAEVSAQAMSNPVIMQALMGAFSKPEVLRQMRDTLRQDLTDDQLQLFQRAMAGATAFVTPQEPPPKRLEKKQ